VVSVWEQSSGHNMWERKLRQIFNASVPCECVSVCVCVCVCGCRRIPWESLKVINSESINSRGFYYSKCSLKVPMWNYNIIQPHDATKTKQNKNKKTNYKALKTSHISTPINIFFITTYSYSPLTDFKDIYIDFCFL